jgi:hypothetical protein
MKNKEKDKETEELKKQPKNAYFDWELTFKGINHEYVMKYNEKKKSVDSTRISEREFLNFMKEWKKKNL